MKIRDIKTDRQKISDYWDMDVIEDGEDIAEILTIAEYWMEQCKNETTE